MARFYGTIGFSETTETKPGIWTETLVERNYYGDLVRCSTRREPSESINDNIVVNNDISILADPYAYQHFSEMRYVIFMGVKWKIASIQVERPRLILSLGGIYNGQ